MKAKVVLIAFILLGISSLSFAEGDTWSQLENIPTARFDAAVCVVDGNIYVIGGMKSWYGIQTKIEVYDPDSGEWSTKTNMPVGSMGLDAGVVDGKIYLFFTDASVREYDPVTEEWADKEPMQDARKHFGTCELNGKIYVFGGWDNFAQVEYATLHEYDPATDTWTQKTDMPTTRSMFACCTYDGKIYALGGWENDSSEVNGSVIEYDPSADTWTTKTPMPCPVNYGTASAVDGKIYLIGGYCWFDGEDGTRCSLVQEYNLETDEWTNKTPLPIERGAMTSVFIGDYIYVMNGSDTVHEDNGIGYTYVYEPPSEFVTDSNPVEYILMKNYPNPFNPQTTITYSLYHSGLVNLVIYDVLGREVETLVDEMKKPGSYSVLWNGADFTSGVYFYQIKLDDSKVLTHKMLLMK